MTTAWRTFRLLLVTAAVTTTAPVEPPAQAGAHARYVGSATAVARTNATTLVDAGGVVCDTGGGVGAGGLCLPFDGGNAVHILDAVNGENVAFQVCIDNNGDNFCTFPDPDPVCGDEVSFSHDDAGNFFNPIGPLSTGFKSGCPGGSWRGFVVMLCEGAHADLASSNPAHVHPVTSGTGETVSGGEGTGTFCGSRFVSKPYLATNPPGNQTCGMTASNDPTAEGPNSMFGTIIAGPWEVAEATSVQITCDLVVGNGPTAASATASGGRVAALPPIAVSFWLPDGETVQLCTTVTWTDAFGGGTWTDDADPDPSVRSCPLAVQTSTPPSDFRTATVPQSTV
jgi:hypothetical protein